MWWAVMKTYGGLEVNICVRAQQELEQCQFAHWNIILSSLVNDNIDVVLESYLVHT